MSSECCSNGTSCGCGCGSTAPQPDTRRVLVELLFLDLETCVRCTGTDEVLEEALRDVAGVMDAMGVELEMERIHISTEEEARRYGLLSSPTIRVNGSDIQLDFRESLCESCGDICGDDVDCRVWVWQGQEYSVPPKGMLVEALLGALLAPKQGAAPERNSELPENLKAFFRAKARKDGACCSGSTGCC